MNPEQAEKKVRFVLQMLKGDQKRVYWHEVFPPGVVDFGRLLDRGEAIAIGEDKTAEYKNWTVVVKFKTGRDKKLRVYSLGG